MDISERMRLASRTLASSRERIARAFTAIEGDYARARVDCIRLHANLTGLADTVGELQGNLARYDRGLAQIDAGARGIGEKSRELVRMVDGCLAGRIRNEAA